MTFGEADSTPRTATLQRWRRVPKVLHVYPDFGTFGGIERYILTVCCALKRRSRFRPVVLCSANTRLFQEVQQAGVMVYGIKTLPCFAIPALRLFDLFTCAQLLHVIAKEKPDIVHFHIGQIENLWVKLVQCKVIYTFHGYGSLYSLRGTQSASRRWLKRRLQPLFRWMVSGLDRMLFVSRSEQQRMQEEGYLPPNSSSEVLYNGIDVAALKQRALLTDRAYIRKSLGIPDSSACVAFINRLDYNKDPLGFLNFTERLVQLPGLDQTHFIIAGDGPLAQALNQAVVRSAIRKQVHILGNRLDVPELLGCSDLAVFMSKMEGFGLGALEAMATGTLCVATAAGGVAEIMDFAGGENFLVPVGDVDSLVSKAGSLLRKDAAERVVLTTRLEQRARAFDLPLCMQRLEQVYADVLQNGSP